MSEKGRRKMEGIEVGKIPIEVLVSIKQEVLSFSVGLVALVAEGQRGIPYLIGSGTLIQLDDFFAVLTANHVFEKTVYTHRKCEYLGVTVGSAVHRIMLPKVELQVTRIGGTDVLPKSPDLAIVKIPKERLGDISARKSFWNIGKYEKLVLPSPMSIDAGVWALCGCPDVNTTGPTAMQGFDHVWTYQMLAGFSGVDREWTSGEFDYLQYSVSYSHGNNTPLTFGGVSGGGLWQVPLEKGKDGTVRHQRAILSGVAFYETAIESGERSIICHGRRSIYEHVHAKMSR